MMQPLDQENMRITNMLLILHKKQTNNKTNYFYFILISYEFLNFFAQSKDDYIINKRKKSDFTNSLVIF